MWLVWSRRAIWLAVWMIVECVDGWKVTDLIWEERDEATACLNIICVAIEGLLALAATMYHWISYVHRCSCVVSSETHACAAIAELLFVQAS